MKQYELLPTNFEGMRHLKMKGTNFLPQKANVQMIEKGKTKDMWIKIENSDKGYNLNVSDSSINYPIRRAFVEINQKDPSGCTLSFITPTQEITFVFKTKEEAEVYYHFISAKSDVHAENRAIAQLDEEMRAIWPFPGGSFF